METAASMHIPALMGSVCVVAQSRVVSRLVPVLADNSLLDPAVQWPAPKKACAKPKGRAVDAQTSNRGSQDKKKAKGKSRGKDRKAKPTAKSGDVDFDENAQADQDEPEEPQGQDDDQEEDPVEAQSSSESEMDSDGMLDWFASECKGL